MGIQSITTSIPKAARQLVKKYGPECSVDIPFLERRALLSTRLDKYANTIEHRVGDVFVEHRPSGAKIYRTPEKNIFTDANGEIRILETRGSKTIYAPNGNQIEIEKSIATGKPISATIYNKQHPNGILIEAMAESKADGKLCSVRDKDISYYQVTPNGKIRKFNRKNKMEDNEFTRKMFGAEKIFYWASIPPEIFRAAYLGKI